MKLASVLIGASLGASVAVAALALDMRSLPLAPASASAATAGKPQRLETSELTIVAKDGKRHVFTVEMARTPKQQEIGMMYRRSVAPDAGMLFLFPRPRVAAFWMMNTYVPLDLLFIDQHGRIESIAPNAEPHSLDPMQSRGPVVAVLEIAGGRAAELGIAEGDLVLNKALRSR